MTRRLILLTLGAVLTLGACDLAAFDDALDDFRVILSIEAQSTVVGGLVIDARTGNLVEAPVELTYSASVPGAVVDGFGDPIEGETVESGAFNFAISNATAPRPDREVEVAITATAQGYEPTTEMIALADTGSYSVIVRLTRPAGPPPVSRDPAIAMGTVRASGASGTDRRFALEATPLDAGPTTVVIESGGVLEDDGGNPLSGEVEVELKAYSPTRSAILRRRLANAVVVAGFTVSASTPSRAAVDGPFRVTVTLGPGALDPETGHPFQVGDEISAFAYDEIAREWLEAGTATVISSAASGTVLEGAHERLGLFTIYARRDPPTVGVTVRVQRNGNDGRVRVDARGVGYRVLATIPDGETSETLDLPANPRRTSLRASHNGRTYTPENPTTCLDCAVSLVPPSQPLKVVYTLECASPSQRVYVDNLPTVTISVREQGTREWFSVGSVDRINRRDDGSLESVEVTAEGLFIGITYDVIARYLNETQQSTFTVPESLVIEETIQAPAALCQ